MEDATSFYNTLTPEELARVEPCEKTTCVIVSGDSPPMLQPSLAEDVGDVDDVRDEKSPLDSPITTKLLDPGDNNNPIVNVATNAVPVRRTVLPIPEPQPRLETNGWDLELSKEETEHKRDDDACLIDCIYFIQQCCECVIL